MMKNNINKSPSSQKKDWSKGHGPRKLSQIVKSPDPKRVETPSTSTCLSNVSKIEDIITERSDDSSAASLKNFNDCTLMNPENSGVEKMAPLTREEIVLRRKMKVAARKQMKKLEKMQMNEKVDSELIDKPIFSFKLASDDFPTLNSLKSKVRKKSSNRELLTDVGKNSLEKISIADELKNNKTVEKSWKPKMKDPIHIDLSQALIQKHEKHQLELKKADPPSQRNLLTGNILDSDNPKRKKGKVRPDKVQKPSKLKSHILNERKKRLSETKENRFENSECCLFEIEKPCCTIEKENSILSSCSVTCTTKKLNVENTLDSDQRVTCTTSSAKIHSRRFREYCTNCLTDDIISSVCALLEKVAYFQDRMYAREPIKASAKRRYVAGINQIRKYLQVRKVKLLVIAPDLERSPGEGGLDEIVELFKLEAEAQEIPCIFGPNRKRLGKAVKKNTLVSCVAVLSYEGAEEQYAQVMEALHESKIKYLRLIEFQGDNEKDNQDSNSKCEENHTTENDVTSSLLAKLREELPPADRLLNAIQHCSTLTEE